MPPVFSAAWFTRHQPWLLRLLRWPLTGRLLRHVLAIRPDDVGYRGRIVALRPDSYTVVNADGSYTLDCRTHDKYAKRLYHAFLPLWRVLHMWDMAVANPLVPSFNAGFDTLPFYPDPGSGGTTTDAWPGRNGVNETFATIRSSAGNEVGNDVALYVWLQGSATSNQFARQIRSILTFDTSPLTANAAISSAVLSLWGTGGNTGLGTASLVICKSTPASVSTIVAADYSQLTTSTAYSTVGTVDTSNTVYTACTLNAAGISNVSLTGISAFGATTGWDASGSFTGTWASGGQSYYAFASADAGGTSTDPKLVVTYVLPLMPFWSTNFLYNRGTAITTSDTVNIDGSTYAANASTKPVTCDAVYVGNIGVVAAVFEDGSVVNFTANSGQVLPLKCIRVNTTGTTATSLIALYSV